MSDGGVQMNDLFMEYEFSCFDCENVFYENA